MGMTIVAVLLLMALAGMAYVRLAPIDPQAWHQPVDQTENADLAGSAVRVLEGDAALMQAIDAEMRALPRTQVLAGSPEAGRVTYVTRSAVFGFPDFTTVDLQGDQIRLFARLKYGASDLGVNRKRLERVIAAVQ
ncbi:DUF1499 domain-containing protein [uncultured Roseobacter sp.]|uniref:DUF1499 domain-containing protein n=1 Tax=uncultured Roseobacter sp. TaxID=114847 RepID=UPI002629647F|nr:DUF1499 domain-containing protein [uncultured Roseobacter sp.]